MNDDLFGSCDATPPKDLRCGRPKFHAGPCGDWYRAGPAPDPGANTPGKVRADHPDTSRKAALHAMPNTGTQRLRVLEAIAQCPRTDDELQHDLRMSGNSQRPRRGELVEGEWIEPSGEERRTRDGNEDAIVWRLARPLDIRRQ